MRSRAPRTPPGAGIIPSMGALVGPRALPGTYTVKMIKGKDTYTSTVTTVPDPVSTFTAEDRAAAAADGARSSTAWSSGWPTWWTRWSTRGSRRGPAAAAVPAKDPLRTRLEALADDVRAAAGVRSSSSQRGEGISGEEKLREEIGMLYGNVNTFDGPADAVADRSHGRARRRS